MPRGASYPKKHVTQWWTTRGGNHYMFRSQTVATVAITFDDTVWRDQATTSSYQVNFTTLPAKVSTTTAVASINGWLVDSGQVYIKDAVLRVRTTPPWIEHCIPAPSSVRLHIDGNGILKQTA